MKLNGIDIAFLVPYRRNYGSANLCKWSLYHSENMRFSVRTSMVLHTPEEINTALTNKLTDLSDVTKLYFDSSSTYPRFKIRDTKFQRVIKVAKCDAAIIPDSLNYYPSSGEYYLFEYVKEDQTKIIYSICPKLFKDNDSFIYDNVCSQGTDFIDGVKTINTLPKGSTLIYSGKLVFCDETYIETIDNIVSVYPKYAKESALDKLVNGTLEKITEESILSLNDMLASTDDTTVELGLKILQGMNVTESPAAVTCLLCGNFDNIYKNKAMGTTGVSQVFKSLNIDTRYISRDPIIGIARVLELNVWKNATSEDKSLTYTLCRGILSNFYREKDKQVMDTLHNLPFKIKTYVD